MSKIFITGISTEVGKTIVSAILVEALKADYWKPIQAGNLDNCDSAMVKKLISNNITKIHPNSYALNHPMSPHASADLDGITIKIKEIVEPTTKNHLVIEGAGGILVPLNNSNTVLDLIKSDYKVLVVSRNYLGSINHSLLTLDKLKQKAKQIAIVFSGTKNKYSEDIIEKMSGVKAIGRIEEEPYFDKNIIKEYAEEFINDVDFNAFIK